MTQPLSLTGTQNIIRSGGIVSAHDTHSAHASARMELAWLLEALQQKPGSLINAKGYINAAMLDDAVRRYQSEHGLTVDGRVGERTLQALERDQSRHQASARAGLKTPCNPSGLDNYDHPGQPVPCTPRQLESYVATIGMQSPVSGSTLSHLREQLRNFSELGDKIIQSVMQEHAAPAKPPATPPVPSKLSKYIG